MVFDGFLHRKHASVTQRVETAMRAESTATWNEVKVGFESVARVSFLILAKVKNRTQVANVRLMRTSTIIVTLSFEDLLDLFNNFNLQLLFIGTSQWAD